MLGFGFSARKQDRAVLDAISRSLAVIEFDPTGTILDANANFCAVMGYAREELIGRHHSLFCDPEHVKSPAYHSFWDGLGRGEFDAGEYRRIAKGGASVYLRATYNPVLGADGRVLRVVKIAADITADKLAAAEFEAKYAALSKVQAIIELRPMAGSSRPTRISSS